MITKKQYVEYLPSTPKNCTCTYLAEHLAGVSHDVVNAFLHQKRFLPGEVWQLVKGRIEDGPNAVLIVDDSVHDKRYSHFISLVRAQYSGTEHGVVRGVAKNILMAGEKDRVDPVKWQPLIMSFSRFFGLGPELQHSRLAEIPESLYAPQEVTTPRHERMSDGAK